MAESSVNVTEGSGKRLHTFDKTISATLVQDQVIVQGEPYLATYAVSSQSTSIATANSHVMEVMAGSSLNLYIRRVVITQSVVATTAAFAGFALQRLSTAGTGGTVRTPAPFDSTDSAASATAMTLPTATGTELTEYAREYCMVIQTIPTGGPGRASLLIDIDFDRMRSKAARVPAGTANGFNIKNLTAVAGASVNCWVLLSEANF